MGTLADIISSGVRAEDLPPGIATQLDPLLRFVNQGIGGLQQQLQGNLTLTDNIQCEIVTPVLSHGVAQLVGLKTLKQARMVIGYGVGGQRNGPNHALALPPILQQTATPGQVKITCYFCDPTAARVNVAIALVPEGLSSGASPNVPDAAFIAVAGGVGFQNAWADFGLIVVGFSKDASGFVHLRGTIKSGTIGLTAFTLPAGYRPTGNTGYAVTSNSLFGVCQITSAGAVNPLNGSNVSFGLDGITFPAF